MRKPTTIICLAMILALVMSSVAMAAPGYIIGGYRYLSSDVASNPDMMLELNGALADGLSNLIVDLDGTPFNYSNFIAAGGADYEGGFQAFSAANPETIPAGTLIKNPDGTTTPDPAAEAGDTVTVTAITAIDPITVLVGTSFPSLGLPTTNTVTYSDGTTADLAITEWAGDQYDKDVAATYILAAVMPLPDGVTYAEGVTAPTCTVTVTETIADAVDTVTAVDGTVTVVMNQAPAVDPVVGDFTVTMAIDGAEAAAVVPTAITWDAATKTATLTVPAVTATAAVQSVVYTVAYKDTEAKAAPAFEVAVAVLEVSSVSAINATTVEATLAEAKAEAPAKEDFAVLANGEAVAVSAVTKVAADLTNTKFRLTIASLTGKQGTLSVNGKEAAVSTGKVYAFDYKTPEVNSVVAKGNRAIEVTFSEKMDATTVNGTNIVVSKDGTPIAVPSVTKAVLDSTGTIATLTLGNDITVADYKVTFGTDSPQANLVKDVASNAIYGGTEVNFKPTAEQLLSKDAPVLTAATYNSGTGKLGLTFNKAITDTLLDVSKIKVNDVALTAADVDVDTNANDNVLTIQLSTASKTAVNALEGALTITAQAGAYGVKIGTENVLTAGESLAITKETPPVLSSVAYNQETNILTLGFDQAVKLDTANVVKAGISDAQAVQVKRDNAVDEQGKSITDFTNAQSTWLFDLSKTANNVAATLEGYNPTSETLKAFIAADAVKNAANVKNITGQDTYVKGIAGTYTADVTKPYLVSAEYNNFLNQLKLTFNEKIDATIGQFVKANIKIFSDATTPASAIADLTNVTTQGVDVLEAAGTSKTLTFVLKNNGGGNGDLSGVAGAIEPAYASGKNMKVVLGAATVKDEATLTNVASTWATGVELVYKDYTAPNATDPIKNDANAAPNSTHVKVTFNEKVDATTAESIANYVIKDLQQNVLAITAAKLQANGTDVLLTTEAQTSGKPYTLAVSNVKDLQGNIMTPFTIGSFLGNGTPVTGTLALSTAAFATVANSNNDTVTLTFSANVDPASAANIANYTVLKKGVEANYSDATAVTMTGAKAEIVSVNPAQVKITLKTDFTNGQVYRVIVANVKDIYGNALSTSTTEGSGYYFSAAAAGDTTITAPVVRQFKVAGTGNDYATLEFNEELNATTVVKNNFTLDVDGDGISDVLTAQYAWNAETAKATVTLTTNKDFTIARPVVINGVKDIAGNALTNTTVDASSVIMSDSVKPTVNKVEMFVPAGDNNDWLVITFNDNDLLQASAENPDNYVIKDAAGTALVIKGTNKVTNSGPTLVVATDTTKQAVKIEFDKGKYNLLRSKTYTVEIKDAMDQSGNKIDTVIKTVVAATGTEYGITADESKPTLATVDSFDTVAKTIGITFSELPNKASAETVSNYTIEYSANGNFTDTVSLTPILATDNANNTVTINFSQSIVKAAGAKVRVTVENVMDAAGNVIDAAGKQASLTVGAQDPATTYALAAGTNPGTTKTGAAVPATDEYSLDGGATWTTGPAAAVDNIAVQVGDVIKFRVKETATKPAGVIQDVTVAAVDMNVTISVSAADALGEANDGKTELTLPALPGKATKYVYKVAATDATLAAGVTPTGYADLTVVSNKALVTAANAANINVAAVDATGKVVAFDDTIAAATTDATAAVKTADAALGGSVAFDTATKIVLNGKDVTLTNIKNLGAAYDAATNKATVVTALQNDINAVADLNGKFTVSEDGSAKLVITSVAKGADVTVDLTGSDVGTGATLLGFTTLTAVNGAN